ncbi:Rho GTPase activation protein [Mycena galopus ATCC 62051]|nr:Rho GTPase activation protein [Mycena galopus ATCC 62051]
MRTQPATPQQKHQRSKKSMSAFLHFMRPISSAFTNETVHAPAVKRTAEELDFVPAGKPSLVVSLVEAHVAQFINNDRSFTFQLDTEDGRHYLLHALNKQEMRKWLDTIHRVTQTAAKRRLTYLGNPKPQLADHLHDPVAASRDPLAVFGVDLNYLLCRESGTDDVPPGTIPSLIEGCLMEIETRGLTEVGIYRLAGAASTIAALKEAFNRGEDPIDCSTDIHAVCDLVKSWFRVLPEPLFPSNSYYLAIEAMRQYSPVLPWASNSLNNPKLKYAKLERSKIRNSTSHETSRDLFIVTNGGPFPQCDTPLLSTPTVSLRFTSPAFGRPMFVRVEHQPENSLARFRDPTSYGTRNAPNHHDEKGCP